jgi:hypothetical protein
LLPFVLLSPDFYSCFLVGYASHPFLDTMTVNGVKLFYPFSNAKCVFPLEVNNPHRYRLQTGGRMDKTLTVVFLVACAPIYLIANQGYERFIRVTQRNIEAAVRDYNELSKTHLVYAELEAYDMLTKRPMIGTYEIIGALNASTLLIRTQEKKVLTLGKEFEADLVATSVVCQPGLEIHASAEVVDMTDQFLSQLELFADSSAEHFLFGDLLSSEELNLTKQSQTFTSITASGKHLRFNHATYDEIRTLNLESTLITQGLMSVKILRPLTSHPSNEARSQPMQESFAHFTVALGRGETITILRQIGDTLLRGEAIARRNKLELFNEQIQLNEGKLNSARAENDIRQASIDSSIRTVEQSIRADSQSLIFLEREATVGFVSPELVRQRRADLGSLKRRSAQLALSKTIASTKFKKTFQAIQFEILKLKARDSLASATSSIICPLNGVLTDVRHSYQGEKLRTSFILRRPPSP